MKSKIKFDGTIFFVSSNEFRCSNLLNFTSSFFFFFFFIKTYYIVKKEDEAFLFYFLRCNSRDLRRVQIFGFPCNDPFRWCWKLERQLRSCCRKSHGDRIGRSLPELTAIRPANFYDRSTALDIFHFYPILPDFETGMVIVVYTS